MLVTWSCHPIFLLYYQDTWSTIFWISSVECVISAMSSAKSNYLTSIFVFFVFALKCATVKRSIFWRDCMYTPPPMSLKASSPFVIANVSETAPPPIPDVHHHSGMQTLYHGCELFGASIFPQLLPSSSPPNGIECLREVDKDNIQRSILLYALFLELS